MCGERDRPLPLLFILIPSDPADGSADSLPIIATQLLPPSAPSSWLTVIFLPLTLTRRGDVAQSLVYLLLSRTSEAKALFNTIHARRVALFRR